MMSDASEEFLRERITQLTTKLEAAEQERDQYKGLFEKHVRMKVSVCCAVSLAGFACALEPYPLQTRRHNGYHNK